MRFSKGTNLFEPLQNIKLLLQVGYSHVAQLFYSKA